MWRALTGGLLVNFSAPTFGIMKPKLEFEDPTYLVLKVGAEKLIMRLLMDALVRDCTWSTPNIYVLCVLTTYLPILLYSDFWIQYSLYLHTQLSLSWCIHRVFHHGSKKKCRKTKSKYILIPHYVLNIDQSVVEFWNGLIM